VNQIEELAVPVEGTRCSIHLWLVVLAIGQEQQSSSLCWWEEEETEAPTPVIINSMTTIFLMAASFRHWDDGG
jgi:hypothetical protein